MKLVFCDTRGEYLAFCNDSHRDPSAVPVLGASNLAASVAAQAPFAPRPEPRRARGEAGNALAPAVVALEGDAAMCARVLASWLCATIRVVPSSADLLNVVLDEAKHSPVLLTLLSADACDHLLLGLADSVNAGLMSEAPWEQLPRITMITGRDLSALSWCVAKTVAEHARFARSSDGSAALRVTGQSCNIVAHGALEHPGAEAVDAATLAATLRAPADVLSFSTHGADACAKGGAGVVLCGKAPAHAATPPDEGAVLACGYGHPCPRGPVPVALHEVPARIMFLDSCNGLRLGGGSMRSQFNLGLAFLDGPGAAYVSSVYSAFTSHAARGFVAAVTSGATLAEATQIANAFVALTGAGAASFVAIGFPHYHPTRAMPRQSILDDAPVVERGMSSEPISWSTDVRHLVSLCMTDRDVVEMARACSLSLAVEVEPAGSEAMWFYRVESSDAGEPVVRAVVARYPEPIDEVRVTLIDGERVRSDCIAALEGIKRWLEHLRLTGLTERCDDIAAELRGFVRDEEPRIASHLARLRWDGAAAEHLQQATARAQRVGELVGGVVLRELAGGLAGPLWLTNLLSREYRFTDQTVVVCPYCLGQVARRIVRHELRAESRLIDVCPRCGIISDVREGAGFDIVLEAPETVAAGDDLEVGVTLRWRAAPPIESRIQVAIRICTNRLCDIAATPSFGEFQPDPHRTHVTRFCIPRALLPHQYAIKALVATSSDLAFASKLLFVEPATRR